METHVRSQELVNSWSWVTDWVVVVVLEMLTVSEVPPTSGILNEALRLIEAEKKNRGVSLLESSDDISTNLQY